MMSLDTEAINASVAAARESKRAARATYRGREISDPGKYCNPCLFAQCGFRIVAFSYADGTFIVDAVRYLPGMGGYTTGFIVEQMAVPWKRVIEAFHDKQAKIVEHQGTMTIVVGTYNKQRKAFTDIEFTMPMKKLEAIDELTTHGAFATEMVKRARTQRDTVNCDGSAVAALLTQMASK